MWLLNSKTQEMKEFLGDTIPLYAILSHTWGNEEVTLQELQQSEPPTKAGYSKILRTCEQAERDGYEWV